MKESLKERTSFSLTTEMKEKIQLASKIEDRSEGWIIRKAVKLYIQQYPFPPVQVSRD